MNWRVLITLILFFISCSKSQDFTVDVECFQKDYQTERAIIVVIDGPRMSETWEQAEQKYIPFLAQTIAPKAVIGREFYNLGNTYTIPGHIALTTGSYEFKTNNGSEFPQFPSFFQLYLSCTQKAPEKAFIVTAKEKLHILSDCENLSFRNQYRPRIDVADRSDLEVLDRAREIMNTHFPDLILVHFKGPDFYGHRGDWKGYLDAIQETDSLLNELILEVERNGYYSDKTAVIMTNDHGRHLDGIADGFVSHGDNCRGCTHLNFMAYGPDFRKNYISDLPAQSIDILPTIGELLNFGSNQSSGRIMTEIFNK